MLPPIRAHSYDEASNKIRDAAEKVAKSSMIAAASDVKATETLVLQLMEHGKGGGFHHSMELLQQYLLLMEMF